MFNYIKNLESLHKEQTRSLIRFKKLTKEKNIYKKISQKKNSILRNRILKFDNIIKSRKYIIEITRANQHYVKEIVKNIRKNYYYTKKIVKMIREIFKNLRKIVKIIKIKI